MSNMKIKCRLGTLVVLCSILCNCAKNGSNVSPPVTTHGTTYSREKGVLPSHCLPGPDEDGDGVPDWRDRCPVVKEFYNGANDGDGCPDETPIMVIEKQPTIEQQICFMQSSLQPLPNTDERLEQISARLHRYKWKMRRVEIATELYDNENCSTMLAANRLDFVLCSLVRYGVSRRKLDTRIIKKEYHPGVTPSQSQPAACVSFRVTEYFSKTKVLGGVHVLDM